MAHLRKGAFPLDPCVAPYGSWASPVTADVLVAGATKLHSLVAAGDDLFWLEDRPEEAGRSVLVRRRPGGAITDVVPPPFSVGSRVHEYGGGAYAVGAGRLYFVNRADQRIYRLELRRPDPSPLPLTPAGAHRYADLVMDAARQRLLAVREDHSTSDQDATAAIVALPLGGDGGRTGAPTDTVLAAGHDFFSSPRLSPDGRFLCWLSWDHPNMPWDGTDLWVAPLDADGRPANPVHVAGGPEESVTQPLWGPDGRLYFVSDRSGWWNLYRVRVDAGRPANADARDTPTTVAASRSDARDTPATGAPGSARTTLGAVTPLAPRPASFGQPAWQFGQANYAFCGDRLLCAYEQDTISHLAALGISEAGAPLGELPLPFSVIEQVAAGPTRTWLIVGAYDQPLAVVGVDPATGAADVVHRPVVSRLDAGCLSQPEPLDFPTTHGETAHALYYPPRNERFRAPEGERPPLLVQSHGGPTGCSRPEFKPGIQFWTSRGFAVVDVNYRGSTGYGRAYRNRLRGEWGVLDVDDCAAVAQHLAEQGLADPRRLAIRGGSAGGFTTIAALTFRDVFKAGASRYGISDLETLARDTHKFESRYLERLVGPYPAQRDRYAARSPIYFSERLNCPMIFFQGDDDQVVPPAQSQALVDQLRRSGTPVAYLTFEGEGHGFRKDASIRRSLEAELYFYSRIFGFALPEPVEPVEIWNLEAE